MRQVSIPVGVIVARQENRRTTWHESVWRVAMIVAGVPAAEAGSLLRTERGVALFYAGGAELSLHPSEVDSYRRNLEQPIPLVYAVLAEHAGMPELLTVTVAPDEAEAYFDSDGFVVDAAPMPPPVAEFVSAYVDAHSSTTPQVIGGTGPEARLPARGRSA